METQAFQPHPALQPFVRLFLTMQGDFPDTGIIQHITPKGEPAIFFPFRRHSFLMDLIQGYQVKTDLVKGFEQPFLIGQSKSFGLFNWKGRVDLCIAALQPHILHHFLQDNAGSMTNCFYSFDAIGRAVSFRNFQDRLWEADKAKEAVQVVESYLLQCFLKSSKNLKPTNALPYTNWINRHTGMLRVDEVAKKFQITRRRLEQQFSTEVGLTPKEFARIVRFRAVAKRMYNQADVSWMRLVADFNYTDQSHLIRDFQQFAGVSPTMLSEERPLFDQLAYAHAFR